VDEEVAVGGPGDGVNGSSLLSQTKIRLGCLVAEARFYFGAAFPVSLPGSDVVVSRLGPILAAVQSEMREL